MLSYKFDIEKTIQAAALLLKERGGRMDRMRLLKLLYIADRELLSSRGRTLTGDRAVAMKMGPVLSTTYDLIKGSGSTDKLGAWSATIKGDGYDVILDKDVGKGRLTRAEEAVLRDVSTRYRNTDSEELSELTHEFREWVSAFDKTNPTSSFTIDWAEALAAQGKADLIAEAEELLKDHQRAEAAFRG